MALDNSLTSLLATLTTSIESATQALPQDNSILPPKEGISLLDVKNELLLSYLQNLVFLILLKIRARSQGDEKEDNAETPNLQQEITKKLVELRVYLEKGVRPLENRLKYQINNIIKTADDATRKATQATQKPAAQRSMRKSNADDSDVSDAESAGTDQTEEDMDETTARPNAASFVREKTATDKRAAESAKDGIYRPPRITPMAMATTERKEEKERRPGRSATIDEFVANELSTAPIAEPSIGSTIVAGGRRVKSERERREETERQDYEESNFVRLPAKSKKDQAKERGRERGGWGGEELRGLGAGLDRIERLTQKKGGSVNSLAKSRKRPIEDGPRGTGAQVGEAFEKRRKVVSRHRK
jgi:U3 small nucleolar ribonucleoprotein protein LCP5